MGMRVGVIGVLCMGIGAVAPAWADLALAQKSGCTACHAVDKKVLGPAFQEVAAKYGNKPEAVKAVVASIKAGGVGKWGQIPMPAQAQLSDADATALATWILNGAK